MKEEADFFGYVVSKNGMKLQNIKTLEMLEFQTPTSISELKKKQFRNPNILIHFNYEKHFNIKQE